MPAFGIMAQAHPTALPSAQTLAREPIEDAPGMPGEFRRQPVMMQRRRTPGWKAWLSYAVTARPAPTVPPQVHSSAFQPRSRFHSQWIIPGAEPWNAKASNDGRWFRAFMPNVSLPGGAQQQSAPRFGWVWNTPRPSFMPAIKQIVNPNGTPQ